MAKEYPFRVWDGVYRTFAEAAADEHVFEGDIWLNKVVARAEAAIAEAESGGAIPAAITTRDYVLPVIAAAAARPDRRLRILDFGGGLAASFIPVAAALPPRQKLRFVIVENAALCAQGEALFAADDRIAFQTALPQARARFDIVHCGSSLNYVEDWVGLLKRLLAYRPHYLVLADLPAADNRTFVTAQAYYGRRIASWFWNVGEFVAAVEKLGYELAFRARHRNAFLGPEATLPVSHFPAEYRPDYFSQLVFRRPDADRE